MPKKSAASTTGAPEWLPGYLNQGTAILSVYASFAQEMAKQSATSSVQSISLYYYAARMSGWQMIAPLLRKWQSKNPARSVTAFVGTDHGLTEATALQEMKKAGVDLHLVTDCAGTYHPKVIVLETPSGGKAWIGSHNLSGAAFKTNVEFGLCLTFASLPDELTKWREFVKGASESATDSLINSYRREREPFAKKSGKEAPFVWSRRKTPKVAPVLPPSGSLAMQVMEKETGSGGKQIQPPMATLIPFFGLATQSDSREIEARMKGTVYFHRSTVTGNANSTSRIHIPELDYSDRPCFIVFQRKGSRFEYEIVRQAEQPALFDRLVKISKRTTANSRLWKLF